MGFRSQGIGFVGLLLVWDFTRAVLERDWSFWVIIPGQRKTSETLISAKTSILVQCFRCLAFPDPREDPKSRSLNGGSYKVPLVVQGPKLGDLLSRSKP